MAAGQQAGLSQPCSPCSLCHLAEHLLAVGSTARGGPLSVRGGELTCLRSAQIIHGLQGEKKTFCSCAVARWHGGRHGASTKHLEDVFAATYSTSFPKAQLRSSEEAAVTPLTLPSLVLSPSAACFPLHPLHRLHRSALHGPTPASWPFASPSLWQTCFQSARP